jgi:hypothetical protein
MAVIIEFSGIQGSTPDDILAVNAINIGTHNEIK